jgi:hypothetical protein
LNNAASLVSELQISGVPGSHAEKLAAFVYSSSELNRIEYITMKSIFAYSSLKTVDISKLHLTIPPLSLQGQLGVDYMETKNAMTFRASRSHYKGMLDQAYECP